LRQGEVLLVEGERERKLKQRHGAQRGRVDYYSEGERFLLFTTRLKKTTQFYPFFLSRNGLLGWAFSKQSRSRAWAL